MTLINQKYSSVHATCSCLTQKQLTLSLPPSQPTSVTLHHTLHLHTRNLEYQGFHRVLGQPHGSGNLHRLHVAKRLGQEADSLVQGAGLECGRLEQERGLTEDILNGQDPVITLRKKNVHKTASDYFSSHTKTDEVHYWRTVTIHPTSLQDRASLGDVCTTMSGEKQFFKLEGLAIFVHYFQLKRFF